MLKMVLSCSCVLLRGELAFLLCQMMSRIVDAYANDIFQTAFINKSVSHSGQFFCFFPSLHNSKVSKIFFIENISILLFKHKPADCQRDFSLKRKMFAYMCLYSSPSLEQLESPVVELQSPQGQVLLMCFLQKHVFFCFVF